MATTEEEAKDAAGESSDETTREPEASAAAADETADDEEAAAEGPGEEGEGEADEEPAAGEEADEAAAKPAAAKGATAKATGDKMTPGQRLAAAKAAKAAKKASQRGRDAQKREDKALKQAATITDWMSKNRKMVLGVGAAVVALAVGLIAWSSVNASRAAAASSLLWEATRVANAQIVGPDDVAPEDPDVETAPSVRARAEKALRKYREVLSKYPSSDAAVWARLGEGAALLTLDKPEEARQAYEKALRDGGEDPTVAWRALEGIAFAYEAQEKYDDATRRFQELARVGGGGPFRDIADYHLARVQLAKGDENRAKETLRGVYERLQAEGEDEEDRVELPYLRMQVEELLGSLDSSAVPRRGGMGGMGGMGGPGGADQLTPEQIQELMRRLQAAGGEGAGAGGE